jgi:parvulin-like peptidyl-prolyl isomerase
MTLRARSGSTRPRRSNADNEARQKLLVTLGFIGVILTAVGILGAAVALTYYNDHLRAVATVDGTSITHDQLVKRAEIKFFNIGEGEKRVRESLAAGEVGKDVAAEQLQLLGKQRDTVAQDALDDLVRQALLVELTATEGIAYSDADLEAALSKEASKAELRKVLAIFVRPEVSAGAEFPDDQQRAAARANADAALARLKAGTDFGAVARQYSNDISKELGGDYGVVAATNPTDRPWVKAVFALPVNGTSDVIEGLDGTFRIGRVTEITAAREDPSFRAAVTKGPGLEDYKRSLIGQVLQQKITDKLVAAQTSGPVEQVHAFEIFIAARSEAGEEVRASHILYSPKRDPGGASALASDDPGWADAQAKADAAAAALRLLADVPTREAEFAKRATAESDDSSNAATGGDLGWFARGGMVQEFGDAIFVGTHLKGDIIGPVRTQFGWHLILFESRRLPPKERAAALIISAREPNADFAAIAKEESAGIEASKGGDLGWIAPGQSRDAKIETALFGLQAGQVSDGLQLVDGIYIYKVTERATRPLTVEQINQIGLYAFNTWYEPKRAAAAITFDTAALGAIATAGP